MSEPKVTAAPARAHEHEWEIVGRCTHGFGGQIFFEAAVCKPCGQGGHRRTGGYGCPRRAEKREERAARIERQIAACPVWDKLPERWQEMLRA